MPDAVSVKVGDAVVAALAAATLSQAIEPIRSYANWHLELTDNDLHVDVVASIAEQTTDLSARGVRQYTIPIDIAVRRKFQVEESDIDTGRIEIEKIDALMLLTEEIHELFMPERLTQFNEAVWQDTVLRACPMTNMLFQHRQFVSVVRVLFRHDKAISP